MPRVFSSMTGLVIVLLWGCCLLVGSPTGVGAQAAMGTVELTVLRDGEDVTSEYMAMATSESSMMPRMFNPSPAGTLAAHLPAGWYTVVVMHASAMGGASISQMPAMIQVNISAGETVRRVVEVSGGGFKALQGLFDSLQSVGYEGPDDLGHTADIPGEPIDLDVVPSTDEVVGLARRYYDEYWELLDFEEQQSVRWITQRIAGATSLVPTEADVAEVTSAAVALAAPGASREMPVVLAAQAVMAMPEHVLALNNFAAILRLLDELRDSITVLLAARKLDPQSPMILTNLANSLYELGDVAAAEALYNEALQANDSFGPALTALGNIYMARRDYKRALEMMLRGAQAGSYSSSVEEACCEALDAAYDDPDSLPPPPPMWQTGGGGAEASGGAGAGGTQMTLIVPRMADWSSIESLKSFNETGIPQIVAMINRGVVSSAAHVQQFAAALQLGAVRGTGYGDSVFKLSYDNQVLHLRLIHKYFRALFDRANRQAHEELQFDRVQEEYMRIHQSFLDRLKAAATQEQVDAAWARFCAEATSFARTEFARSKSIWMKYYPEAAAAIEDYWAFSRNVLDTTYDPTTYRYHEASLRYETYGMMSEMAAMCSGLAVLPLIHADCGRCGGTGVVPTHEDEMNVPESDDKCPWKDGKKFSINLGPISYKVDCSTVEVGFALIAAGSLKWNFKEKRVASVFVGVGGQAGVGPVSLGTKFGATINFEGPVARVTPDWSSSVGLGPVYREVSTDAGLVTGGPGLEMTPRPSLR
ncbi:MAG: tetratricopeptide repeat protein [Bacillota bacterium]|nr:hypothetical protein [Bacillota bacterium]